MPLGPIEPLNFVIGRQLALNQNVDASTATRHGLVGAVLGMGFVGPIIARELARRDAEAVARRPTLPTPDAPSTGRGPGAVADQVIARVEAYVDSQKAHVAELKARAEEYKKQAQEAQAAQSEALQKLTEAARKWGSNYETSPAAGGQTKAGKSQSSGS